MSLPLGIKPLILDNWQFTNAHTNFVQKLKPGCSFELTVSDEIFESTYRTFKEKYHKTTENFQWLIQYALEHKIQLRAMGSGWSFSKVAVCEDGLINTKKLRLKARLGKSQVAQSYLDQGGDPDNLLLAQCGNTIISINDLLEKERNPSKSLRASGGSNGQTIVGALSTGTHGAALKFGALSEFIVGMHIITGPESHVWLERASYPVTSEKFQTWMDAKVILDDELFNSALISFGSFGFIHSVLIEVEPKFLLEQEMKLVPYNEALEKAITGADFSGLTQYLKYPLESVNQSLYHFEIAINPHNFEKYNTEKGAYMRVMYKIPYRSEYPKYSPATNGHTYGDDVLGLIQEVLDIVETLPGKTELALIPKAVNALFKTAFDRPEAAIGTIGETFRNTVFRGKLFSAAYTFDSAKIPEILNIALSINRQFPFAGVIAMRFIKGTQATLGPAQFQNTCVLELDGVDAEINHKYIEEFTRQIDDLDIRYGIHWGKINKVLNIHRIRKMYGNERVDKWLNHRDQLLSREVQQIFNNDFIKQCGLDLPASQPFV